MTEPVKNAYIYTILAYKPSSVDMCRNCVMERYDSDFQWFASQSEQEITERLAGYMVDNCYMKTGEAKYHCTFLINGNESQTDEEIAIVYLIERNAETLAEFLYDQKESKALTDKAAALEAEAIRKAQETIVKEKAEYQRLKAKFEVKQ